MTKRWVLVALLALSGCASAAEAQTLVEVIPDIDKTFVPKPVETAWIAEPDLARLSALGCVAAAGAYRLERVTLVDLSGAPRSLTQRRIDPGALKALGWVLPRTDDDRAALWVSEPALEQLQVKSREFPMALTTRLTLVPVGGGPASVDQKVWVAGVVTVGLGGAPLTASLILKPGRVLRTAQEKLIGQGQMAEAVPPHVVLRTRGEAGACLGPITEVVNGWGPRPGAIKYRVLIR